MHTDILHTILDTCAEIAGRGPDMRRLTGHSLAKSGWQKIGTAAQCNGGAVKNPLPKLRPEPHSGLLYFI